MTAICRSCEAPVRWVRTTTGRAMPVDLESVADGNLVVLEEGTPPVFRYLRADETPTADRFVSHFATCPQRDEWRRKSR